MGKGLSAMARCPAWTGPVYGETPDVAWRSLLLAFSDLGAALSLTQTMGGSASGAANDANSNDDLKNQRGCVVCPALSKAFLHIGPEFVNGFRFEGQHRPLDALVVDGLDGLGDDCPAIQLMHEDLS